MQNNKTDNELHSITPSIRHHFIVDQFQKFSLENIAMLTNKPSHDAHKHQYILTV